MYVIGENEIKAVAKAIRGGKLWRYRPGSDCGKFEARWAKKIGVPYAGLCNTGTSALMAGLVGLGVGPGHEVIVPSFTYMASAMAVVAVGAIPVVADVDESLTLCPKSAESKISRYTGAIIPVHMNGLSCHMDRIMRLARKHKVKVLEDAAQAVGGGYRGKRVGSIGDAGGFSFNYFKNISCGEGGAVVTKDRTVFRRATNFIDACVYYWDKKVDGKAADHFGGPNLRFHEIGAAIMIEQLKRLDGILRGLRREKKAIVKACDKQNGLRSMVNHDLDHECGATVGFIFETAKLALAFRDLLNKKKLGAYRPLDTGRHVYTEWDPILRGKGAHHPALDPYRLPANKKLNKRTTKSSCRPSLDLLARTVFIRTDYDGTPAATDRKIDTILNAAKKVL